MRYLGGLVGTYTRYAMFENWLWQMAHLIIRSVSLPSVGDNQVKTGDHWRIFADYPLSGRSGIEVSFNVKLVLTHNTSLILSNFLQSLATIKYPKTALGPADELQ